VALVLAVRDRQEAALKGFVMALTAQALGAKELGDRIMKNAKDIAFLSIRGE